ncbi:hypothetical protein NJB1604_10310 [Mycobacterium marinum]|nr:hypothetical protein NJB1604_10310 [Mycobacterium marinum]
MLASARLPCVGVLTGVASQVMVSDLLSCQGGTFRHYNGRTGPGPGPGAAARVDTLVRVRPSGNRSRSAL